MSRNTAKEKKNMQLHNGPKWVRQKINLKTLTGISESLKNWQLFCMVPFFEYRLHRMDKAGVLSFLSD